jgi:hypothetical protein
VDFAARVIEEVAGAGGRSAGVISVEYWDAVTSELTGVVAAEVGTPLLCSCSKSLCAHSHWFASNATQVGVSLHWNMYPVVPSEEALKALCRTLTNLNHF